LLENRALLLFTTAITLFHFANAAMCPWLARSCRRATSKQAPSSWRLHHRGPNCDDPYGHAGRTQGRRLGTKADLSRGLRRPPIRGVLYTLTDDPYALVAIQLLDGVGAGIFGALFFIVVADLTKAPATTTWHRCLGVLLGLGAALSNFVAGFIVNAFGFSPRSCSIGLRAGCFLFVLPGVPETGRCRPRQRPRLPSRCLAPSQRARSNVL